MSDNYQILNPKKVKYNQESLGKKPLKGRLRKRRHKEAKNHEKGDWCPYYQRERAPIWRMALPRRIRGSPVRIMSPSSRLGGVLVR
jgi:hypothetical protein